MSDSRLGPADGARADDVLATLDAEPCPRPDCDGQLQRDEYKDSAAVVCEDCAVPAARVWGERS